MAAKSNKWIEKELSPLKKSSSSKVKKEDDTKNSITTNRFNMTKTLRGIRK